MADICENAVTCTDNLVDEMRKGILCWYPFQAEDKILYVGENDPVSDYLTGKYVNCETATSQEISEEAFQSEKAASFDYIVLLRVLERSEQPELVLEHVRPLLKDDGLLLLGVENRLGLRYFVGDREPFSNRVFDGIENYFRSGNGYQGAQKVGGRLYSRSETVGFLTQAGFGQPKVYSVLPAIENPQIIYAEDTLPNEELAIRLSPYYHDPFSVFLREEQIYSSLIHNDMFHQMANAWLMECPKSAQATERDYVIKQVTVSMDRGRRDACATIIRRDEKVEKVAFYPEGAQKLQIILKNTRELSERNIPVVPVTEENGRLVMPFVQGESAIFYMQRLLMTDKEAFIQKIDELRELILQSSEVAEENELGVVLKKGYIDLILHNALWKDGQFVFIDQEFAEENYPANAILFRNIAMIYDGDQTRESILPSGYFWEKYDMVKMFHVWTYLARNFTNVLRNEQSLLEFNASHGIVSPWHIPFNRKKIDEWGYDEWELRDTCFDGLTGKKLYIYGAGAMCDKLLAFYHRDIHFDGIFDDNAYLWSTEKRGVTVYDPVLLNSMNPEEYKVIIAARDFRPIYKHVRTVGAKHIGLYDAGYVYPGKQRMTITHDEKKPYRIGYLAGVFDLIHYGHLRMFQRAKEQCDYLIVGVVMDEGVRLGKKKEPFIPFEERIQMVQAMEDVDEAVEIPYDYPGTVEAFQKYHFDVQFSGSDYVDHPWWLEQQQYLREHGAELVFYSYTEQTSSTKIRALIEQGLEEESNEQ